MREAFAKFSCQMCTMSRYESEVLGILSLRKMLSQEATVPFPCRRRADLRVGAVGPCEWLEVIRS